MTKFEFDKCKNDMYLCLESLDSERKREYARIFRIETINNSVEMIDMEMITKIKLQRRLHKRHMNKSFPDIYSPLGVDKMKLYFIDEDELPKNLLERLREWIEKIIDAERKRKLIPA